MAGHSGEANTDPKFIYGDDLNVVAYRLGIVETDLKSMDIKLDRIINEYPTHAMLELVIRPMREKLKELEDDKKTEAQDRFKQQQSLKVALFSAIISPIASVILILVMANTLGLNV